MEDLEKLRHLIDHWIEHSEGHGKSYLGWAERAEKMGKQEVADLLREVAEYIKKQEELLTKAKAALA
jgi:rubrerythrin